MDKLVNINTLWGLCSSNTTELLMEEQEKIMLLSKPKLDTTIFYTAQLSF